MAKRIFKGGVDFFSSNMADFLGPDVAEGITPPFYSGIEREYDGKIYVLCWAQAALADGVLVKDTLTTGNCAVNVTAGANESCIGVNNTGQTVPISNFFWALKTGVGYCKPSAAISSGQVIISAVGGAGRASGSGNSALTALLPQGTVIRGVGVADDLDNRVFFSCK